jgi:protein involved in polysaccharide export with SLBB domain
MVRTLIFLLSFACLLQALAGCNSSPDKRTLQYLNTQGFGNRYSGNAEEENWLAIGDQLSIADSYNTDLDNITVTVDIDGTVVLPELGAVRVAGLTRTGVEALLMEKYSPYYDRLDIKVKITTRNKKYYVFGETSTQGEVDFPGDLTLFQAVTRAGPKDETANLGRVRLIRADPKDPFVQTYDLGDMISHGYSTFNVQVQENDIIYVPPSMMAEIGYFLDTLFFPVKQVLTGLASAIFSLSFFTGTGNFANASSIF